jgi:hypothetical protein
MALATIRGVSWPYDVDFYRAIAQAQVFSDGAWNGESFYRGERSWYPPLVPAIVSLVAAVVRAPIPQLFVWLGPWLNLLGPIAIYVLCLRFFGRIAALFAALDYLYFRPGWLPAFASGTYSPWLFSTCFAQGLFLAGLALYERALSSGRVVWFACAGVAAGLTFLAHTAPFLILALAIAGTAIESLLRRRWPLRTVVLGHAALALAVLLVTLPNLLNIVGHYQLHFLNAVPSKWVWSGLRHWTDVPLLLAPSALLGVCGLVATLLRRDARPGTRLVQLAAGVSLGATFGLAKTPLLPPHHLLAYLQIALSVGFGLAIAEALESLQARWPRLSPGPLAVSAALLAALLAWPSYTKRRDFWQGRAQALAVSGRTHQLAVYDWLLGHTRPQDVVLANDDLGMSVAGPAGRGVVAIPSLWASPFVDDRRRHADRDHMLAALRAGDGAAFCTLAHRYDVSHVLRLCAEGVPGLPDAGVTLAFDEGRLCLYAVSCAPPQAAGLVTERSDRF